MANPSAKSVIIVGGGIVGLTTAVVLQARGHKVTVIARDPVEQTASGVAAGMIAPVLEGRADPYNDAGFAMMRAAQAAWIEMIDLWPAPVRAALREQQVKARSVYAWRGENNEDDDIYFAIRHVDDRPLARHELDAMGVADGTEGRVFGDDWLVDAAAMLHAMQSDLDAACVARIEAEVISLGARTVRLGDARELKADHVVVAAGSESAAFSTAVPGLGVVQPIKGHLLDLEGPHYAGVIRSSNAYLAGYGAFAKFGATMESGKDDTRIDPAMVDDLKARAIALFPALDVSAAMPRVGIRAASPDGWPMIGRDRPSGVLVATAMRRNGYVFAPLAARIIADLIEDKSPPEATLYDPNRFS